MTEIRWEEFQDSVEYGGTIRFAGTAREISEQFLLAAAFLRDKAYGGGAVGIDYTVVMDRVQTSRSEGFGGWLQGAFGTLLEIRKIAREALSTFAGKDEWKARAWLAVRRPLPEKASERAFSESSHISKSTVHRAICEVDQELAAVLRRRGYVIRNR